MHGGIWLLALAVCALMLQAGPLPPACGVAGLDFYQALGASGCSIGPFTFKDFQFLVDSSGGGTVPIPSSAVIVNPALTPGSLALRFESSGFSVSGAEWVIYTLSYNIDPPPVIIRGFEEELEVETPIFPGLAAVDTNLCVGGTYSPLCTSGLTTSLSVFHWGIGGADLTESVQFSPLVNMLGVQHTIRLEGNDSSADFRALENRIQLIPEPAAWLLVGCGLLALPFLRRRPR